MRRLRILALAGLLVMGWTVSLAAEGAAPKKEEGEIPLRITAARMEADKLKGIIIFSGQVKAVHGDATLYSDQLWIYLETKPEQPKVAVTPPKEAAEQTPLGDMGSEQIDHIVAKGNVRMVQEDRVATGDEAVYYKKRDEVVLTGNPQLWRAENTLKGERIIFNLKTNKVLVESSPQRRVEALLYSQGASEGKAKQPVSPKARKSPQP
ncbi:MAG: LptA/OstA family protein [Desulfobaccales bacterium]